MFINELQLNKASIFLFLGLRTSEWKNPVGGGNKKKIKLFFDKLSTFVHSFLLLFFFFFFAILTGSLPLDT